MNKHLTAILLTLLSLTCSAQESRLENTILTVSPVVDKESATSKLIITALTTFLNTKNNSLTENEFWSQSDFQKYVYPYLDIYNIEQSKYGKNFFKPTVMEIIPTANDNQKIVKIAFIGHNAKTNENLIKAIYNVVANIESEKIVFSSYLDFATQNWVNLNAESVQYLISPKKEVNYQEIENQRRDIKLLCEFFGTTPIAITYFSCTNPKELFEIKGFDYNPMMYVDTSGGMADFGNSIFSGNNAEIYTHEIVHIYTNKLYPNSNKFIDEGLATYIAGSGRYDYEWHRNKLSKFISENPMHTFIVHPDPYERFYFEVETSIPYLTAALICERTKRIYGTKKLLEMCKSETDIWLTLDTVGLTKENISDELKKELNLPQTSIW